MRQHKLLSAVALAGVYVACCGGSCNEPPQVAATGEDAKQFSAQGTDEKTHTLASLTEGGKTLVLYFVKNGCGANPEAVPLFKKLSEPFTDAKKVNFVAVFNDQLAEYKEFESGFGVNFLALLDPGHEVIKSYGIKTSQGALAIQDGKIVKRWKGFSQGNLTELGHLMAKAEGTEFKVDLSDAPAAERFG